MKYKFYASKFVAIRDAKNGKQDLKAEWVPTIVSSQKQAKELKRLHPKDFIAMRKLENGKIEITWNASWIPFENVKKDDHPQAPLNIFLNSINMTNFV